VTETFAPRPGTRLAYGISALTTLLWFACVLPAGPLAHPVGLSEDQATPLYRASLMLVPALLVLVIGPAGIVLSQGRSGRIAVLTATDAFLAGYAGVVLLARLDFGELVARVRARDVSVGLAVEVGLILLMLVLAGLSAVELARVLRRGAERRVHPWLRGLRLALCLFVLAIPSWLLLSQEAPLSLFLVPFLFVGASAAGATFASAPLALRRTASIVHALLAVYLLLVLKATLFHQGPAFASISAAGWATLGLAAVLFLLAFLQVVRIGRHSRLARARDVEGGGASDIL
jgi:hypothetical protein